ncbi:MAG: AAA family ATPase, partial [Candidatus Omnitrophica bacterium]|nr:AAA family ATPase [Candidatus Omnitrophota bacterium]
MNPIQIARKRLKYFFIRHWIKLAVVITVFVSIMLPWAVLSRIDSYQRIYLMAWLSIMPIQSIVSAAIFVVLLYWLHYGGGFQKMKKSHVNASDVNIRWGHVIGMEQAKIESIEIVKLIKDHLRIEKIGGKMLRGLLMMGPPGCGKTYLAKAIATEAGVPFISISGAEFVEMYVGVGASRVRQLFKQARMAAEEHGGCIIFIDEIDSIAKKRTLHVVGGQQETDSTQNQLLAEMDGLETQKNVVVIGATNAQESSLDEAILRPGRFDRKVFVQRPDGSEREALFRYYMAKVKFDKSMDIARLARKAVYKTPSDINNIVQEAALISTRNNKEEVDYKDMMDAMDRIDLGYKHKLRMNDRERTMTAYHETGHAVALYFLHPEDEANYATIISRGGTLGHVQHVQSDELYSRDCDHLRADIMVSLAGYAAERKKFNVSTTGVSQDFKNSMNIAHFMVWKLGMGSSGLVGDYTAVPAEQLAEDIKNKLNGDTQKLITECLHEVEKLLDSENQLFENFAQELLQKEELD